MFTGIVETIGHLDSVEHRGGDCRLVIAAGRLLEGARPGDSIAVSGVCLTVAQIENGRFAADVSTETLAATTAGGWTTGRRLNLEAALTAGKPLGGHFVSGHVDGVGHLVTKHEEARSWRLRFSLPPRLQRYVARKGSITVDGVSLTVNEVDATAPAGDGTVIGVNIVPHTLAHTTLGDLNPGDPVNLEVDLIARYLETLLSQRP